MLVAACHHAGAPAPAPVAAAVTAEPQHVGPGPGTAVVTLAPGAATPVAEGPFLIEAINPGGSLDLAVAPSHDCGDPKLAWFSYSGGGTAVGSGQTLCARSQAGGLRTHGFSGRGGE